MAKVPYIGVDGVARKCKSLYIGVDGVARKVKSGYIGVNGVAMQFFSSVKPVPLSTFAEGDIVYINENGSPVEFYVAKHNYESGLNGSGRTLLVRKDCYRKGAWNTSNTVENAYASSLIDSRLNDEYKGYLDADIQNAIETTKFYYTIGNGDTTVTTLERSIFLLSVTEYGYDTEESDYCNTEGSALSIYNILRPSQYNGSNVTHWTRSPNISSTKAAYYVDGTRYYGNGSTYNFGYRPAFTLPEDTLVTGPSM